jgi:hypothetical protein
MMCGFFIWQKEANMPYVTKAQIEQARKMDLLTYFQNFEPQELVRIGADAYSIREHDSLKISNGKWCWWSRRIGYEKKVIM